MTIEWDESLSVNIDSIDEQHKKLLNMFLKLHDEKKVNELKRQLGDILDELFDYTKTHFSYEEKLMHENGYEGYEGHKKIHENMTNRVIELKENYNKNNSISLLITTMKFLTDWLVNHISKEDKKYSPFLANKDIN